MSLTTVRMSDGRSGAYVVVGVDLRTGAAWWSHHELKLTRAEAHAMAARQVELPFVRPLCGG